MKLAGQMSGVIALGFLLGFAGLSVAQNGPTGNYEQNVTDPGSLVWDLTSIADLTTDYSLWVENDDGEVVLVFPRTLEEYGSGKLAGTGQGQVSLQVSDDQGQQPLVTFPGTYKTTGSITSNKGLCKIKMNTTVSGVADFEGATRRLSASENVSVTVNNATLLSTGTGKSKASASGLGSISGSDSWSDEPLDPAVGNGAWTLRLLNIATTGGKTVTGSAEVTLHSGAVHHFSLKGVYNSKKQETKLVLIGLDAAKGANLTVTIGAANTITAIKGKLFGQMVNVVL